MAGKNFGFYSSTITTQFSMGFAGFSIVGNTATNGMLQQSVAIGFQAPTGLAYAFGGGDPVEISQQLGWTAGALLYATFFSDFTVSATVGKSDLGIDQLC
jgi:hypothetical protein